MTRPFWKLFNTEGTGKPCGDSHIEAGDVCHVGEGAGWTAKYSDPLVRVVGENFSGEFLHGTRRKNIKTLTQLTRPEASHKENSGNLLLDAIAPAEQNEFGAEMFLSEPRQPHQAVAFASGPKDAMAVVHLKPGTKVLDLSDEVYRKPTITFGEPGVIGFHTKPAITDDMIQHYSGRIAEGYKQRHPDWEKITADRFNPKSGSFDPDAWQGALIPYARSKGWQAIRLADETLVIDRNAIASARAATPDEFEHAKTTRTYPGSKKYSLFTDQPTGAHDEAMKTKTSNSFLRHVNDWITNAEGKPCGDSFIPAHEVCHVPTTAERKTDDAAHDAATHDAKGADAQIVTSVLDQDLYSYTVGSVVRHNWPDARVSYTFVNRGGTQFPPGFDDALRQQVDGIAKLRMTPDERAFLKKTGFFSDDDVDWFSKPHMDAKDVHITQDGGDLKIDVSGLWSHTIEWEVPLLSTISELYFKKMGQTPSQEYTQRINSKVHTLAAENIPWMDFGTRRRWSQQGQEEVVKRAKDTPGFLGTSNVDLARRYNLLPLGTMSHQGPMGMQALVGVKDSNKEWMNRWENHFGGKLATYLGDTITTDAFLKDLTKERAAKWSGLRQDSGEPAEWARKILAHFNSIGVDPKTKSVVFSDALTATKVRDLHREFKDKFGNVSFGIGTNFSHDVATDQTPLAKPLNIVVKMTSADFGSGRKDLVKLSDSKGKFTGSPSAIEDAKKQLGLS